MAVFLDGSVFFRLPSKKTAEKLDGNHQKRIQLLAGSWIFWGCPEQDSNLHTLAFTSP